MVNNIGNDWGVFVRRVGGWSEAEDMGEDGLRILSGFKG